MLIEQALMTYLLAQTGITNLVGNRIYFVNAPQEVAKPYIVVIKIDAPREHSQGGSSHLAHPRFQLSIFSETYADAKSIAAAVQSALMGYSDMMGGEGGVKVGGAFYENEVDFYEDDTRLFHLACDYIIWHYE